VAILTVSEDREVRRIGEDSRKREGKMGMSRRDGDGGKLR